MKLRSFARSQQVPICSFQALHEGISQEKGLELDSLHFNNMPSEMEVCVGARILLIANLAIEHELMNRTQGTIEEIVYFGDANPNHESIESRMPHIIIINCPKAFRATCNAPICTDKRVHITSW